MMFKSKHSGWTWDLKRTPFGGGGGFLASIDPIEAFKGAANSVADTSHNTVDWMSENGWMLPVAMITAGVASGALSPAALSAEGGAALGSAELAGPSLAGSQAFDAAIASGLSTTEAAAAADAAAQAAISAGQGIGTATGASAGSGLTPSDAGAFTDANLGYTGAAQELGLEGSTTGLTDLSGTQGSAMLDSMGLNTSGMSASDIATNANRAKNIAKMLSQGSNSGLASSLGQLAQGQTGVGMAIPAILRGNQNPFLQTAQQPIRNAQPMDLSSLANLLKQG